MSPFNFIGNVEVEVEVAFEVSVNVKIVTAVVTSSLADFSSFVPLGAFVIDFSDDPSDINSLIVVSSRNSPREPGTEREREGKGEDDDEEEDVLSDGAILSRL